MLCSALQCVKVGGRIVYSTCSISPLENDLQIEKLLNDNKRKERFNVVKLNDVNNVNDFNHINNHIANYIANYIAEDTQYGKIFLPDYAGRGPLFIAVLERTI